MIERLFFCAVLSGALWQILTPSAEIGTGRRFLHAAMLILMSWTLLSWTSNIRLGEDEFPRIIPLVQIPLMTLIVAICGSAAFRSAGRSAFEGTQFAFVTTAIGALASRWPALSRALELNGEVFAGPFISHLLSAAFAATVLFLASAILLEDWRPYRRALWLGVALCWAVPTVATEYALTRWYGLGPRTLAQATGLPHRSTTVLPLVIYRFNGRRGEALRPEIVSQAIEGIPLSRQNLNQIQAWLTQVGYRHLFAGQALMSVRRGWLKLWDAERALDAMMTDAPGRVHPDYRGALDLIKVGPLTPARFHRLERLDASAAASTAGFEDVTTSQYIFEGFAAAYARYGDEENARRWLMRIDNLFGVSDKKLEVAPLEDFRQGRVSGSLRLEGSGRSRVLVGLFQIWRSTPTATGTRLLSSSTSPDALGRYQFAHLGPGEYEIGLLGPLSDLSGRVESAPRRFEIDFDRPRVALTPILFNRRRVSAPLIPVDGLAERRRLNEQDRPFAWRKR